MEIRTDINPIEYKNNKDLVCVFTRIGSEFGLDQIFYLLDTMGIYSEIEKRTEVINGKKVEGCALYVKPENVIDAVTYGTIYTLDSGYTDIKTATGLGVVDAGKKYDDYNFEIDSQIKDILD